MNFNNPDDINSSSPLSADNQSPGGVDATDSASDEDEISADAEQAPDSEDSSQSSAKLDAALRQASNQAGTQRLDLEEDGDMTMDIAEDEVTASFKPWARNAAAAQEDQENVDPSSPAATVSDEDDMSMDITRAVGRIVPQDDAQSSDMDDDMSMELNMPLGGIKTMDMKATANRRKSLKRPVSMLDASQGSPAKRPASRRTSLRQQRQLENEVSEDATMDLTMAIGAIKSASASEPARRASLDTALEDATMDFTLAVGSIKSGSTTIADVEELEPEDEDLSMEFTKIVGPGIKRTDQQMATPEKPVAVTAPPSARSNKSTPNRSSQKSQGLQRSTVFSEELSKGAPDPASPIEMPAVVHYPTLDPGTPEIVRQHKIEDIEPSPFIRQTPQGTPSSKAEIITPTNQAQREMHMPIPEDPIAAPILNRRRSSLSNVQFSPLNAPREEPTLKSTAVLTNNIKLLSTPRKQTLMSPMKRGTTPKKSQGPQKQPTPKQKTSTPKKATPRRSMSPKKRVAFGESQELEAEDAEEVAEDVSEVERISLQDFLDMTKIRFMDLSTTKRRHTAAPALFHDIEVEEKEETLDRYVVAGACTLPEYELYQHACHEMKKYISDGRHFVRTMEANVMEDNPLLFSEYLTAPPDQRLVMDNQFKNLKTNARLEARGEWYTWRSTLLHDLKSGLLSTLDGFKRDESKLANQEQLLDTVLPPLAEKQEKLSSECKQLQQRHDELNSCDREELEQTREKLVATDVDVQEKRLFLEQLQQELVEKEARIQDIKERKLECIEETKAAERMREECRGWSTSEVNDLKGMLDCISVMRLY
jgi:kinetochore protein Spc7/SPC105